jgi:hypothetical protein
MYKKQMAMTLLVLLFVSTSAWGAKSKWKPLKVVNKNIEKSVISAIIKKEVKLQGKPLLSHKYLVRIEILGGGGPNKMSETVFHFRKAAKFMVVTSTSDLSKRSAVTFSNYKDCKLNAGKKRHYCPGAGIAGEGAFDMTSKMKKKNILIVSRSRRGYKAKTIIWLAYDNPEKKIFYYQFTMKQFGLDALKTTYFSVNPDISPELPPDPIDGIEPGVSVNPRPVSPVKPVNPSAKPVNPSVKPVNPSVKPVYPGVKPVKPMVKPVRPVVKRKYPKGFFPLKLLPFSNTLSAIFKKDYISRLFFRRKTEYLNWVRIQVSRIDYREDRGGFKMLFARKPVKLYIYAWTDKRNIALTSVGNLSSCSKKGINGCPYRIDGRVWYDFSRYIKGKSVVVRSFPRSVRRGSFILWAAFKKPVSKIRYYRPGFKGGISVYYKNAVRPAYKRRPAAKARPTYKRTPSWD